MENSWRFKKSKILWILETILLILCCFILYYCSLSKKKTYENFSNPDPCTDESEEKQVKDMCEFLDQNNICRGGRRCRNQSIDVSQYLNKYKTIYDLITEDDNNTSCIKQNNY